MNRTIPKKKIKTFLLIILLLHTVLISFPNNQIFNNIRDLITIILFFISIFNISIGKVHIEKKFKLLFFAYLFITVLSSFVCNSNLIVTNVKMGSIRYALILFNSLYILSYIEQNDNKNTIINSIYYILLFYLILNDILLFFKPTLFFSSNKTYYLVGNKFSVAYLHLQTLILYLSKKKGYNMKIIEKLFLALFLLITFFVSIKIKSGTAIVSIFLFIILSFVPKKILASRNFFTGLLIFCCIFAFNYERILSIPTIQNILLNLLHRSLDLTGRTVIFGNIPNIISGHLLFGYGYGSSWEVWYNFIHYPNSQNGLIDLIVEQGIISTVFFIILCRYMIKNVNSEDKNISVILVLIYIFICLSSFEITIDLVFVFYMMLLYILSRKVQKELKK